MAPTRANHASSNLQAPLHRYKQGHAAKNARGVPAQEHAIRKDSPDRLRRGGSGIRSNEVPPVQSTHSRKWRLNWDFIPDDVQNVILGKLEYQHLYQVKRVSKLLKTRIESDGFQRCRGRMHPREGLLTAIYFSVGRNGVWQCGGYDLVAKTWRKLPPFDFLPQLDPTLFKGHSICGAHGMMCANVGSTMIVFNPMTRRWRRLPSLNHPRTPVLMHMVMVGDSGSDHYKIIVAGSARAGHEHLSKITEVFDSRTGSWTSTQDVPGPLFALNEHQSGVTVNGILFCVAFLDDSGKGLIAYNVDEGRWVPHLTCRLPHATNLSIVQLVESNGELYLFSEIERNLYNAGNVEQRIDVLEEFVCGTGGSSSGDHSIGVRWRNVMTETKVSNQAALQTYPEYTCVPFGEGKLCIFNTIAHTGVVYDVQSGKRVETLPSPTVCCRSKSSEDNMKFYSLNPITSSFEPSFKPNPAG